jgi:hypothetical protein
MPTFRTLAILCALWLGLLSPAAAAPRTHAGSSSCHNCAGSGQPEFGILDRDLASNCAPMSANPDWVSLESGFAAASAAAGTPAQWETPERWAVLYLEPRIHNEVKVGTPGLPELNARGDMASSVGFVGWPDKLAEYSPYDPDRRLKDRAPDCLRGSGESKTTKSATEATGEQVRRTPVRRRNSALFKLPLRLDRLRVSGACGTKRAEKESSARLLRALSLVARG